MSRNKIYIADAIAERTEQVTPFRSESAPEFVVTDQRRVFFKPVWFTAPNFNNAYKAVKTMAYELFPASEGYQNQGVSGLTELKAEAVLATLTSYGAITAADLRAVLKTMEGR